MRESIPVAQSSRITLKGALTTLHSFGGPDGNQPSASALIQATDGNFYGTTQVGGAFNNGTIYRISPAGKLTTIHSFATLEGTHPRAGLVQATNGDLYGTTQDGGAGIFPAGTLYEITTAGVLTVLYNFCSETNCLDGSFPSSALTQATNGLFYGTTGRGGSSYYGTAFSLGVGLAPFVEPSPTSGKVGTQIVLLGTNLTGATGVTFNGHKATFVVVSTTKSRRLCPGRNHQSSRGDRPQLYPERQPPF